MFFESFRITSVAVFQILLVAGMGYFLVKKGILSQEGIDTLSKFVVEVALPIMIFCQLIRDFRFDLYPNWWAFPLLSLFITIAGLAIGAIFVGFIKGPHHKMQFLSLTAFQNSGYLPLALISAILPKDIADVALVYLFLFLLGFNLIVWSFGVYMLSFHKSRKFEFGTLFSPPVIAVLASLLVIFFGWQKFIPGVLLKPLNMVGNCTVPLAMMVVGGSLAAVRLHQIDKKAMFLMILSRLLILPGIGLLFIMKLNVSALIGFIILMELAVPSATSLSVITRHYKNEDLLISQGVFFGHLASLVTLPLFLSVYLSMVKLI